MHVPSRTPRWPVALATGRLLLRPIERRDVAFLSLVWTDPDARRHLGGPLSATALSAREDGCVGHFGAFVIVRRTDRAVLGLVSVEPRSRWQGRTEVSYQLLPAHRRRGYGREAVGAAVDWALGDADFGPAGVVAVTQEANHRSRRLLESLGTGLIDHVVEWDARQAVYALDHERTHLGRSVVRYEELPGTSPHGSIRTPGSDPAAS
ncbi:GNAT family N-acetyltransferase [Streptomyces sp. NBC_00178]|nr:GNAT family N-acetyltransferase [Streptomyces sp. NBC_00178]